MDTKPPTATNEEHCPFLALEYEMTHQRWSNATNQRRTGLAFFTAVQGTLISLMGEKFTEMDARARMLAAFAIIVTLLSWNNERRLGAHMDGYLQRALDLEQMANMRLFHAARESAKFKSTLSNRKLFTWYFVLILLSWSAFLSIDILKVFSIDLLHALNL